MKLYICKKKEKKLICKNKLYLNVSFYLLKTLCDKLMFEDFEVIQCMDVFFMVFSSS